ncbi:MAG: hypothetical protein HS115_05485 [Spirochaetales bacterium]|nr:hypothetical protein [Spirochaetales bacterium]
MKPLFCLLAGLFLFCQSDRKGEEQEIDHLHGRGLRSFFAALRTLEEKREGVVRILFIGDSTISGDNLTLQLRNLFTERFGHGGAGLVTLGREAHLRQQEARHLSTDAIRVMRIPFSVFHLPDFPGLGFTGFSYSLRSHTLYIKSRTVPDQVKLIVRGDLSPTKISGQELVGLKPEMKGPCRLFRLAGSFTKEIKIQIKGNRDTALLDAVILEKATGVTLSPLVQMGLHQAWMQGIPDEHLRCGLELYRPQLIILQSGINEAETMRAGRQPFDTDVYREQLRLWFEKLRNAYPGAVLVFGPPERLISVGGRLKAQAEIPLISAIQAELALKQGFAFFDTYNALGGEGGMQRMMARQEAHRDGTHLTYAGGEHLAQIFFAAILKAYRL